MTDFPLTRAIGILGGTFDPIHYGHLRPCLDLLQQLNLAEVRLMPNHIPPHRAAPGSNAQHRLTMAALAVENCDELSVDTRELNRSTPSYTIDTLIELAAENPTTSVYFLIGLDSLNSLHTWYRWQELLDYCHLVVSYRPNYELQLSPDVKKLFEQVQTTDVEVLQQQKQGRILLWPTTQLEISATRIRQLIKNQQNPQYLLPDNVLSYIQKNNLYA
ncbi:MAG: nicotinate-nucleotide adenylyltransferase [Moritella sp.]|uniref:nicotinate-nucleotide adenylyltransferase n=1 Tax=Moritella sp. TaxID=78556 RepID=UPI0029A4F4A4|nr:nicotinate-nucleotide adenylyltransferase [Moritella sp.]MDX2320598.1 nicotinate-nucleotide adenylyltransferase [Moritella sp.]